MNSPEGPPAAINSAKAPPGSYAIVGPKWESLLLTEDVEGKDLIHGSFTDVGAKGRTFTNTDFSYSNFTRAYFHKAKFVKCKFIGCRFYDCNFREASFTECDFRYASFNGTVLPRRELIANAPEWPNLRRELMQILRANAESVGDYDAQKDFIREEMEARREHLRKARARRESYYQRHYAGFSDWLSVRWESVLLYMDRHLLGHGEHLGRAAFGSSMLVLVIAILLFVTTQPWSQDPTASLMLGHFWLCLKYAAFTLLDVPVKLNLSAPTIFVVFLLVLRYFLLGLLVASLSRLVAHR